MRDSSSGSSQPSSDQDRQSSEILHPIPVRRVSSQLYSLESPERASGNSIAAQVGRMISPVPGSQKTENRLFRAWLGQSTSSISTSRAVEGSRVFSEGTGFTPGVSERLPALRESSLSLPEIPRGGQNLLSGNSLDEHRATDNIPSSSGCSQILRRYDELLFRISNGGSQHQVPLAGNPSDNSTGGQELWQETHMPLDQAEPDTDEAWKMFVFDEDTDEIEHEAFAEARHEAARMFHPSDYSVCLTCETEKPLSEVDSIMAAAGTTNFNQDTASHPENQNPSIDDSFSLDTALSSSTELISMSSSSQEVHEPTSMEVEMSDSDFLEAGAPEVGYSDSMLELDTDTEPGVSDNRNYSPPLMSTGASSAFAEVAQIEPSSSTPVAGHSLDEGFAGSSKFDLSPSVVPTVANSLVVEVAQSEAPTDSQFRFAPPRLFVGSRSTQSQPLRPARPVVPVTFAPRRRGRARKRARDGRADIRALPNYSSDPIEEIEDEDVPPPSLFGPLELT